VSVPRPLIVILPIALLSLVALMFTPVPRGLLAALGLGQAPRSPHQPSPAPAGPAPTPARAAAAAASAPAAPSVPASAPAVCGNAAILTGPSAAPAGAVTVPAGDNSGLFGDQLPGHTTYYFAAGPHYLGSGEYSQIQPGRNDTFIGAPGAVISGDNPGSAGYAQNNFAFIGSDTSITGVTIKYLTIEGFDPPGDQGAVNTNSNDQWTIEHDTITGNVPGAAVMAGSGNTIEYNCMTGNGQYAFNAYADPSDPQSSQVTGGPQNIVLRHTRSPTTTPATGRHPATSRSRRRRAAAGRASTTAAAAAGAASSGRPRTRPSRTTTSTTTTAPGSGRTPTMTDSRSRGTTSQPTTRKR
jgi:hypothetical protein